MRKGTGSVRINDRFRLCFRWSDSGPEDVEIVTADTDLRLCRVLGLSPGCWLRAQAAHDTEVASALLEEELERIQPLVSC